MEVDKNIFVVPRDIFIRIIQYPVCLETGYRERERLPSCLSLTPFLRTFPSHFPLHLSLTPFPQAFPLHLSLKPFPDTFPLGLSLMAFPEEKGIRERRKG